MGIQARATLDMPPRARPARRAAAVALRATRPVKGDRTEQYFYCGWRLVEQHNGSDQVLGQFIYGTYVTLLCHARCARRVAGGPGQVTA